MYHPIIRSVEIAASVYCYSNELGSGSAEGELSIAAFTTGNLAGPVRVRLKYHFSPAGAFALGRDNLASEFDRYNFAFFGRFVVNSQGSTSGLCRVGIKIRVGL